MEVMRMEGRGLGRDGCLWCGGLGGWRGRRRGGRLWYGGMFGFGMMCDVLGDV